MVIVDVVFRTTANWFDCFTIALFKIGDVFLIIPPFVIDDFKKLVKFEFLILKRMRILMIPLIERDISTDEI